jgi:glutamine amidotransferase
MGAPVTVVDYGLGNIYSITNALRRFGAEVELTADPGRVSGAERLVLPGVGAFRDGMAGLVERGLVEPLVTFVASGRPFLGICLGMQMMLDRSEEFGDHAGLGLIPGRVAAIPGLGADGSAHKVPHIGWNAIVPSRGEASWQGTLLKGIPAGTPGYFVHSFTAVPADEAHRLADAWYNGLRLAAVIRIGNAYGCQYHPEKSGERGLDMIRNFLELEP